MKRYAALMIPAIAFAFIFTASARADENPSSPAIVNHLTMNQWVCTNESGELSGRVFLPQIDGKTEALPEVSVAILARDGKVLRAKTNAKGEFKIQKVDAGVYALTARGDHVFAACAMQVVDQADTKGLEFPVSAEIPMANIDYTVVNTALIRYLPPNVKKQDIQYSSINFSGLKEKVCGQDLFRVAQDGSGMKGRLHVAGAKADQLDAATMTNVFLFKDTMEIDRTISDASGKFSFENTEPGFYSLMAIGPNGIGLIGFELVDPATLETTASVVGTDGTQLVRLFGRHHNQCCGCCQEFAMQIAPMPEICNVVEEIIIEEPCCGAEMIVEEPCCGGEVMMEEFVMDGPIMEGEVIMDGFGTPMGGGGFAPGYGGGGGFSGGGYGGGGGGGFFGGGGGGIGALAGLAGIGAIIAASDDDDNGPILAPVVASPSAPN